ncbi:BolA family protein [Roseitalea porphyridii]|uniref:BolA family transcriptional regulator n=1 Tax=Roseitalea porphyridii TaxID=1852022 RepID=A0A4P6UYC9_9HYPH|nr:BolA family protein [Roseitalea porphyridii]QBK29206.1 BolA family transcriptional regulator [Roseitalea porphyridii]
MRDKLTAAFAPERLEVINESHLHAGHQGGVMDGTGETHFRVRIVSAAFDSMARLARHRAVNAALAEELANGVHALAIEPAAPGEAVRW